MIRYGIVGIGGFARSWVRSLQATEEKGLARLAAAVVRNRAKYADQAHALESKGCEIYPTLEAMLAHGRGRIDIVGVPTGISYHAPMAIQAMEAGYNVHVEKPVAATIQEVLSLQETECRTGCWCAVGYQWIYSPTMQWLREKIASGRLGDVLEARSMIGWPRGSTYYERNNWAGRLRHGERWVLDGPATNATAHYLTNMLYLVAAQGDAAASVSSVRGELYRAKPIPSYDTSSIEVQMSGGARVLHYASHSLSETLDPVMEITCQKGSIRWEARSDVAVIEYSDGTTEEYANPESSYNNARPFEQVARVVAGKESTPLCGLTEGGPQVLTINLTFESSRGVFAVDERHMLRQRGADGSELVCIEGMAGTLTQAYTRGLMFSELRVPWARETHSVSAKGYASFPSSNLLQQALKVETP